MIKFKKIYTTCPTFPILEHATFYIKTFWFEKQNQKKLVTNSSKRKQYFLNILYQRVKFWHGLFPPTQFPAETVNNMKFWNLTKNLWHKQHKLTHTALDEPTTNVFFSRQSAEADNMRLILGEHRYRHLGLHESTWCTTCNRIVKWSIFVLHFISSQEYGCKIMCYRT